MLIGIYGRSSSAVQVAMAHLFFNLSGILIWYVVPVMRKPPIAAAKFLGRTTSKYRWFAVAYVAVAFFLVPLTIFGLSLAGWQVLVGVGVPVLLLIAAIVVLKVLQIKRQEVLPEKLQTMKFLPVWMRSLEPIDKLFKLLKNAIPCCQSNSPDLEPMSATRNDAYHSPAEIKDGRPPFNESPV
eukprot:scpid62551/ scgid5054/ Sodium-dependent phosphate transport protein 2B; Na(+)-dependent phosphate cotransporter 2B; Sodium/phosphate cotransporter 2B; Solute carrier family 34 member 2